MTEYKLVVVGGEYTVMQRPHTLDITVLLVALPHVHKPLGGWHGIFVSF